MFVVVLLCCYSFTKAEGVILDDLTGQWKLNQLISGEDEPFWCRGFLNVDFDGAYLGVGIENSGESSSFQAVLRLQQMAILKH